MSSATLEQKNGALELTKLEYHKKWYLPIYFPNSVSGQNISKINANGPFCPKGWYNGSKNGLGPETFIVGNLALTPVKHLRLRPCYLILTTLNTHPRMNLN